MDLRRFSLVASVLLAAGWGCRAPDKRPTAEIKPSGAQQRVMVLNADALVIDGKHVRLANAFAPKGIPHARCWAEALASKQATAEVRRRIRSAVDIRVEPTGGVDEYNRAFARVLVDRLDLGDTLHAEGLAASEQGFDWCAPISQRSEGAPDIRPLIDLGAG